MDAVQLLEKFGPMAVSLLVMIGLVRHLIGNFDRILDKHRANNETLLARLNDVHEAHKTDLKQVIVNNTASTDRLSALIQEVIEKRESDKQEIISEIRRYRPFSGHGSSGGIQIETD